MLGPQNGAPHFEPPRAGETLSVTISVCSMHACFRHYVVCGYAHAGTGSSFPKQRCSLRLKYLLTYGIGMYVPAIRQTAGVSSCLQLPP